MAPELIKGQRRYTTKIDIWSIGIFAMESHKWTLTSLWKRFAKDGVDCKPIMSQIHDIVIKTLISVQQELAHNYRTVQPSDVE